LTALHSVDKMKSADGPASALRCTDTSRERSAMPSTGYPEPSRVRANSSSDEVDDEALERVMAEVPRGALALSGLTVGLLLLAWFLMYALVFLPRGTVG
jgi:hypothetical protein